MAGLSIDEFLSTRDENRRSLLQAIARAATELRRSEAEYLAVQISNNVMKGLGG